MSQIHYQVNSTLNTWYKRSLASNEAKPLPIIMNTLINKQLVYLWVVCLLIPCLWSVPSAGNTVALIWPNMLLCIMLFFRNIVCMIYFHHYHYTYTHIYILQIGSVIYDLIILQILCSTQPKPWEEKRCYVHTKPIPEGSVRDFAVVDQYIKACGN